MASDKTADWRPDGWESWSYARRRIWRLEQQLVRWEAIAFAARELAHDQAAVVAQLRGQPPPTPADIDAIVLKNARSRWSAANQEVDELGRLLETDIEEEPPSTGA